LRFNASGEPRDACERRTQTDWLGLFVEFFEHFPVLGSPLNKSVGATALNHRRSCARTRKLCLFRKLVKAVPFDERAVGNQLVAERKHVRILLRGIALLQDSCRASKHRKAIRCATAAPLSALHAAEKDSARLLPGGWLCDGNQEIGAEHRQQLTNVRKEHFHIFAIGFGQLRAASLVLLKCESADLYGFREEPVLKVSHMSLGEILVLADKHYGPDPEFFRLMLFQALADNLRLTDIRAR